MEKENMENIDNIQEVLATEENKTMEIKEKEYLETKGKVNGQELDEEEIEKIKEDVEKKKGLNAIRPDVDARIKFSKVLKVLSQDRNKKVTQNEAFKLMLNTYINAVEKADEEKQRTPSINFRNEIWQAEYHLDKLLAVFRDMQVVAQDTFNVAKNNANAQIENRDLEIETLKVQLETANSKINSLEVAVAEFPNKIEEKDRLINTLNLNIEELAIKNTELEEMVKESNKAIKTFEKEIDIAAKTINAIEKEIANVKEDKDRALVDLNTEKNKTSILESSLSTLRETHLSEIESIRAQFTRQLEVEKNLLNAENKLEVVNLNNKIANLEGSIITLDKDKNNLEEGLNCANRQVKEDAKVIRTMETKLASIAEENIDLKKKLEELTKKLKNNTKKKDKDTERE